MFGAPVVNSETVDLEDTSGGERAVYRDLVAAIREGSSTRADGREGRMSLELANAITLSSHAGRPVTLPLDRAATTPCWPICRLGGTEAGGAQCR